MNGKNILPAWLHTFVHVLLLFSLTLLPGCFLLTPEKRIEKKPLEKVPVSELPDFTDDQDKSSLISAVEKSLVFYDRVPADRTYALGDRRVSARALKASLHHFLALLEQGRLTREIIAESFDVYRFRPSSREGENVMVTGYYEPILEGRLEPDEEFSYPLYRVPPDLVTIDLSEFDRQRFGNERLVGRLEGDRVVPYYTRTEIDGEGKLRHCGCELVYLKDPVKAFFLHVQGSGAIKLADGDILRVGYAGKNGRPYRSIGRYLIQKGAVTREAMSLQAIEQYLEEHPEERNQVLWHNESYVFFRKGGRDGGPVGSIAVKLTAGRSIATDPDFYPRGALAFLQTQKPVLSSSGEVEAWHPLERWVLNQDAGGAIKGGGRVDLFVGSGLPAERIAGRMKHPGSLYVFIKKGAAASSPGTQRRVEEKETF